MAPAAWHVCENFAELSLGDLQARLDLAQPQAGLRDVAFAGVSLESIRLLQVLLPRPESVARESLADRYVRGRDLVATYDQTEWRSVRPQVYWRCVEPAAGRRAPVGVDLVLSVQTSLLESDPALRTRSRLPRGEVWRLADDSTGRFERLDPATGHGPQAGGGLRASLFLFRLPASGISYAEMVYPGDFQGAELRIAGESSRPRGQGAIAEPAVELTFPMFCEHLEKGVIRRGRVRGVFLDRDSDQEQALAAYRELVDQPPPLTA
jgi:hypothetical protein